MAAMIEVKQATDMVTCASCKHCYVSFTNMLFGGRQFAKCKRTLKTETKYDPVTGKVKKTETMDYCSTHRGDYSGYSNECGPQGIHWVPKSTKDVFTALKRGAV